MSLIDFVLQSFYKEHQIPMLGADRQHCYNTDSVWGICHDQTHYGL